MDLRIALSPVVLSCLNMRTAPSYRRRRYMLQALEPQLPAYPIQNALTGAIRAQAAKIGETEMMSLWAGQGVAMARAMPAARLVERLVVEWRSASI